MGGSYVWLCSVVVRLRSALLNEPTLLFILLK